ncbi:MAG: selenide, water dikinase SelD [Bacteroidetes bacterium]|nr:selenide, water dikinase SelD [Bacteroidota bacterium]
MSNANPSDLTTPSASDTEPIRLTAYSHGAGCGCKIAPDVLSRIIAQAGAAVPDDRLLVGNDKRDDAAVYALDDERVIISTTDFFMPIVDDPEDFGGIASVNAISDIYAMGGTPMMAIAILGWPIDKLSPEVAGLVLRGAREACSRAGIPLAGGHSIDAPEPIFGLAVTGSALRRHVKANSTATEGCELYLTKPLGIGILTTAQKRGVLEPADLAEARRLMLTLNDAGAAFGRLAGVRAMTDVTGFGLLGHLVEMCEGSGLSARIRYNQVPRIAGLERYLTLGTSPGGTSRNFKAYGHGVGVLTDEQRAVLCDPQTSGGLLLAVEPAGREAFLAVARGCGLVLERFGSFEPRGEQLVVVQ